VSPRLIEGYGLLLLIVMAVIVALLWTMRRRRHQRARPLRVDIRR